MTDEQLTKRFTDILNHLEEGDTVTISKDDLREAIIELREETMVAVEKATRERDIEVVEKMLRDTGAKSIPKGEMILGQTTWLNGYKRAFETIAQALRNL